MKQTSLKMFCLEQLYCEYSAMLYKLACRQLMRYTGSSADAMDMVQDVFVLAARKWDVLREHTNQAGWLIRATQLVCMNHAEKQYRHQNKEKDYKGQVLQKQPMAYGKLYSEAVGDETPVQDILISLEQVLRAEDYEILKAYCIEKRSLEEISQQTGLSAAALRVRIHRIRQEIAKILLLLVTLLVSRNI